MGRIFDIQRFCLHDGPGLRTAVFFKGCPLRCRWCSNPESQSARKELFHNVQTCLRCGACVQACPRSNLIVGDAGPVINRHGCVACGACEEICPKAAIIRKGNDVTAEEVLREVEKDRSFHETSGGGVTFSGGEPFLQTGFLLELLTACRTAGINTAVETTAHADFADIEKALPLLDTVLVDVKHTVDAVHAEWTGVGVGLIMDNVRRLARRHARVFVRIPVIPGFNTDADAFAGFAAFLGELALGAELLPYHVFGEGKYRMLGRAYPGAGISSDDARGETERLRDYLADRGVKADIGG